MCPMEEGKPLEAQSESGGQRVPPKICLEMDVKDPPEKAEWQNNSDDGRLESLMMAEERENNKHERARDNRVTDWGFCLICCVVAGSFIVALAGPNWGVYELLQEFMTMASSICSLILGYLFAKRKGG